MENYQKMKNKMDELIETVQNDPLYQRYLLAKKSMQENKEIMDLINQVKEKQKCIVRASGNKEDSSIYEEEIASLMSKLEKYPIYQEYSYLQEDLNEMFQELKFLIENSINKEDM